MILANLKRRAEGGMGVKKAFPGAVQKELFALFIKSGHKPQEVGLHRNAAASGQSSISLVKDQAAGS